MKKARWLMLVSAPGAHWVWLSIGCYATACFLPAIRVANVVPGYVCLIAGMSFSWWWSNPAYFFALICYKLRRFKFAAILGGIALALALHFEFSAIRHDELFSGCVMWVVSFQIFTANAVWRAWIERKRFERQKLVSAILEDESPQAGGDLWL